MNGSTSNTGCALPIYTFSRLFTPPLRFEKLRNLDNKLRTLLFFVEPDESTAFAVGVSDIL